MRYELKSIGIWALIKVSFFFNLIMGFLAGLLYALLFGFIMALAANFPFGRTEMPDVEMPMGAMMILLPFIFAIGSAIFHTLVFVILAFIYNIIAKLTGGMEFELNPVIEAQALPPTSQPMTGYTSAPPPPGPPPPPPHTPPPPQPAPPQQPMSPPLSTQPPPSPGGEPPPAPRVTGDNDPDKNK